MRRKDREITGRENIEPILQDCKVCRVAMTGTDGWPYVIPMNFGYTWDEDGLTLYFHGGVKGKNMKAAATKKTAATKTTKQVKV